MTDTSGGFGIDEFRPASEVERDADVARRFSVGDRDALEQLFDRFGGSAYTVALSIVGEPERAAAVVQHAYLQAWRNADDFEPGRPFGPWLATLTRRAAEASLDLDLDGVGEKSPLSRNDVEIAWATRAALDQLAADDAEAVRRHYRDGQTAAEIAAGQGTPIDETEGALARARRRLMNRLDRLTDRSLDDVLASPALWADPPADGVERISTAIRSEAVLDEPGARVEQLGLSGVGRRRGWLRSGAAGAAMAVLVVFGGIVLLSALSGAEQVPEITRELTPTGLVLDAGGQITLSEYDAGTQIELDSFNLPARQDGAVYQAIVERDDGAQISAGTFRVGGEITLWASAGLDEIEMFVIELVDVDPTGRQAGAGVDDTRRVVLRTTIGS